MESIKVQYTNPDSGAEQFDIVKFDVTKFRKDASSVPSESIFFTSAATNVSTIREIMDLAEASIIANPMNPYGCSSVLFGLIGSKASQAITLTKDAEKLGFKLGDPIAILESYDSTAPIAILVATGVSAATIDFGVSVPIGVKAGMVAVKLQLPLAYAPNFTSERTDWGAQSILESPNAPVVDATPATGSITVQLTVPTNKKAVTKKYNIYVISATDEIEFNPIMPILKGNRKPDASLDSPVSGTTLSTSVTTWGGGTSYGGGTITSTNTYYVVSVAKDSTSDTGANCSAFSNIDTVVVSYS